MALWCPLVEATGWRGGSSVSGSSSSSRSSAAEWVSAASVRPDQHEIGQREQRQVALGQVLHLLRQRVHIVDADRAVAVPQLAVDQLPGKQNCLTVGGGIGFPADDLEMADLDRFRPLLERNIDRRFARRRGLLDFFAWAAVWAVADRG